MQNKTYELRYLPLFYEDLLQKVTYIEEKLHNPKAASDLIDAVEKAIQDRISCAESFEPYPSTRERELPYYAIYVRNFVIYYVVIDHRIMEVRRFLYKGQNRWDMI
ncbi:MAG: type II toxin-antitoxin system RelE/ParE family toxin [Lachnospiraceae bacterium]|nr:type II toxin-antitoxin system RelE/ParE family toxin [Lachnospiraceae bacterium]